MPEEDQSKLSDKQKDRAKAWVENQEGWKDYKCPICYSRKWTLGQHLVAPPIISPKGIRLGGPSYPQFMIICGVCGYTLYFNAIRSRVSPSGEAKNGK